MSSPTKRNAGQAFEEGDMPTPKPHKKRKRSKAERHGSDAQQLETQSAPQETAETAETATSVPEETISGPNAPSFRVTNEPSRADATPSTKKKRKRKGEEHSENQEDKAFAINVQKESVQAVQSSDGHKLKQKKHHKSKPPGEASDAQSVAQTEVEEEQQPYRPEPGPLKSDTQHRSKAENGKRGAKRKTRQSDGTGDDSGKDITAERHATIAADPDNDIAQGNGTEKSKSKKKKKSKHKQKHRADSTTDTAGRLNGTNEMTSAIPLEDRIEPPPAGASGVHEDLQDGPEEEDMDSGSNQGVAPTGLIPLENRIEPPAKKKSKSKSKKSQPETVGKSDDFNTGNAWSLTACAGGVFIDHDPLLTLDDEHLILATASDVRVYARSTSLLVRKLRPVLSNGNDKIVSYTLSKSNASRLLVAMSSGYITLWDWTEGELVHQWKPKGNLDQIISLTSTSEVERVMAVHHNPGHEELSICIRSLRLSAHRQKIVLELLKRFRLNADVRFSENTGVITATTRSHLLLGYCPGFDVDKPSPFYWRELKAPAGIVTFDVRCSIENRAARTPRVDIALGIQSGEITLYEDLLYKFIGKEKRKENTDISARILHWHRNAPNSLKWSPDGNYLLSGGRETVLVIWQLDTNQQQYLPHLSSEIVNLTVSLKGSSYAIRLGDNSVMVLSSANLDATTNIAGLACLRNAEAPLAASLHPTSSDHLLLTVPKNISRSSESAFALQTYDLNTDRELGRQALTRNSTTVVSTESKSSNLEPSITHLRLSFDGKWLATVESWCPDPHDLDGVTLTGEDDIEDFSAETCLKIWLYNEARGDWELVNRIDSPHARGSIKVLALESSTVRNEFATAGEDGKVRIWRPRARVRDGVPVRNEAGEQLYNWGQTGAVSCVAPGRKAESKGKLDDAAMAYSIDGTVIAASWSRVTSKATATTDLRWTYLLDCEKGRICHSVPDLASHGECRMAFTDRYLVCLSDWICIFDAVAGAVLSRTALEPKYQSPDPNPNSHNRRHLATNVLDGTVAIAVNPNPTTGKGPGKIAFIDVRKLLDEGHGHGHGPVTLFEQDVPGQVKALLSRSPSMSGYVLLDGNAHVSHIRRSPEGVGVGAVQAATYTNTFTSGSGVEAREPEDVRRGLERIFGQAPAPSQAPSSTSAEPSVSAQGQVQGQRQSDFKDTTATNFGADPAQPQPQPGARTLEDILNFQTSAQAPGVGELFERVAGLFAHPRPVPAAALSAYVE